MDVTNGHGHYHVWTSQMSKEYFILFTGYVQDMYKYLYFKMLDSAFSSGLDGALRTELDDDAARKPPPAGADPTHLGRQERRGDRAVYDVRGPY